MGWSAGSSWIDILSLDQKRRPDSSASASATVFVGCISFLIFVHLVASVFLFPTFPSTYDQNSLPERLLCWLPRDGKYVGVTDAATDAIPCILALEPKSPIWMLYSHGNGCDIGEMAQEMVYYRKKFKINVICYEFPGYGIAGGSASPDGCKEHQKIVYSFLTDYLQVHPKNIVLFGRSIGSGIASSLCARTHNKKAPVGALILQSPYINIREMAKEFVGMVGALSPNPLDNEASLKDITCPVLFIHGEQDTLIPATHSKHLFKHCHSKIKILHLCPEADHNYWIEKPHVIEPIQKFLAQVYTDGIEKQEQKETPEFIFNPPKNPPPHHHSKSFLSPVFEASRSSFTWSASFFEEPKDTTTDEKEKEKENETGKK